MQNCVIIAELSELSCHDPFMLLVQVGILPIALKLATQKDAPKWNETVDRDPHGNFFDRFEWCQGLGVISEKINPLPLFIEDDGKVTGVFPLCLIRNSLRKSLESLPFSDYGGGPFFRKKTMLECPEFFGEFIYNIIELGSKKDCLNISIRRAYFQDLINRDMINKPVITDTNTCTFIISLQQGIDQIYKGLKKSRRVSIKEGKKRGVVIRQAEDLNDLQNYYEIYVHTMNRLKSNPLPYRFFEHIWKMFNPRNEVKIFMAEYNNKPVAGILQFIYKNVCYWTGNVSFEKYWDKRPTDVLLWHSIEWAVANDLELFDMGSTVDDPSSGHYFFKKTWGGTKMTLYNYHILLQPNRWKFYKSGIKLVGKIKNVFR